MKVKFKGKLHLEDETYNTAIAQHGSIEVAIERAMYKTYYKDNMPNNNRTPKGVLTRSIAAFKRTHTPRYTNQEFVSHFLNNEEYLKVFKKYEASNYDKQLMPSLIMNEKLKKIKVVTYKKRREINNKAQSTKIYCRTEKKWYSSMNKYSIKHGLSNWAVATMIKRNELMTETDYDIWQDKVKNFNLHVV